MLRASKREAWIHFWLSIGSVAILATVITLGIILIGAAAYQQHHVAQQNGRLHR